MTIEEFRNLAQGLQAVFIAVGAIVASGWAIYTFRSLLSTKKASAELTKLETEIKKSEFDLIKTKMEMDKNPLLNVQIKPFLLGSVGENNFSIRVQLSLKNTGNTDEYIDWNKSTVKLALIESVIDGELEHSNCISGAIGSIEFEYNGVSIAPNETAEEEFLFPIDVLGIYIIQADIFVTNTSTKLLESKMPNPGNSVGFGSAYYFDARLIKTV